MKRNTWKAYAALAAGLGLFGSGAVVGAVANTKRPKTVVHFITFKWKPDATPEQKKAALDGVEKMAMENKGIKSVWTKALKVQGPDKDYQNIIAIEFANQAAFDAYKDTPSHAEWEKVYLPVRGESRTHDVTNE